MAATSAERVLYASKSRKWNSTQCPKFLTEFSAEHAANLDWIRQTEAAAAQRRAEQETKVREDARRMAEEEGEAAAAAAALGGKRKRGKDGGRGKWIVLGVVGLILGMRAWQRYKENTL
jgi:hypothetical protein